MIVRNITPRAIVGFFMLFTQESPAQPYRIPKYEVGINAGIYMYQGDLTPHRLGSAETVQPGIGISGARIISKSFAVRILFVVARLGANESIYPLPEWRQQRNFAFSASVKELNISFHWNLFGTNYEAVRYEPYVFVGAGASVVNTQKDYSRVNWTYFGEHSEVGVGLVKDISTSSQKVIPVIPAGAGIRYHISDRIVCNLEGAYRFMRNDYVDGFSYAANPTLQDHYMSVTVGASYKFGSIQEKLGCKTNTTF
ncbi:MAG: hypothetical protein JST81_05530 [Bacteroidetes bacterium]|jgi:hypothetical protein|nr:hypothetical protein [Bacteroidota bacterium]